VITNLLIDIVFQTPILKKYEFQGFLFSSGAGTRFRNFILLVSNPKVLLETYRGQNGIWLGSYGVNCDCDSLKLDLTL